MIEVTDTDKDMARSIEWVNTVIDNHEAIAQAFAAHRIAALDRLRDLPENTVTDVILHLPHWVEVDENGIVRISIAIADALEAKP